MSNPKAHLGVLSVDIRIPALQSLKEKRRVLKSITDRIRSRFNVSFSEIADLDKWQTSVLGACMISTDKNHMAAALEDVLSFIASVRELEVLSHEIIFV